MDVVVDIHQIDRQCEGISCFYRMEAGVMREK